MIKRILYFIALLIIVITTIIGITFRIKFLLFTLVGICIIVSILMCWILAKELSEKY
jgi:threonine/homoserine/homoserine lactone efflux protein